MKHKRKHTPPTWRVEHAGGGFTKLIGPLAKQKNRQKVMCVAIGSGPKLRIIAEALNYLELEV